MPEVIKSFIVLFVLGNATLYFHRINLPSFITSNQLRQWQFLWVGSTSAAFLSHNYWLFVFIVFILIKLRLTGERASMLCGYICLLILLPTLGKQIPGFGGINFFFTLSFPRLLSIVILLPLFLSQRNRNLAFLRMPGDKLFAAYLLVNILITARNGELTNILRSNFYLFIDIFLPYYAASRSLSTFLDFKKISYAIFVAASICALIALFEIIRSWHLYSSINYALDITTRFGSYSFREGFLRATGPFSDSIVLGYVLTIGLGMGLSICSLLKSGKYRFLIFSLFIVGLLATASRGPWVGAIILFALFTLQSRNKTKLISRSLIASVLLLPFAFFTSAGQKIISLLPFIGESNTGSVSYRQDLFEKSLIVIQRHPVLGSNTYLDTPEMQSLIQGQGIIDIVNSYLRIALNSGFVGVSLFILFFLTLLGKLYTTQKRIPRNSPELHQYSSALIATMSSILLIIATVSSVDIVSQLYWFMAGVMSAYIYFLKQEIQK
jgi:O-antigen ligase